MIEIIKTIGSFVGLITCIFVFYDRLVKYRLQVSLTFPKIGEQKYASIRINNPGSCDIVVCSAFILPRVYGLSESLETLELIESAAGKVPSFVIGAGTSKDLFLVPRYKGGMRLDVAPRRFRVRISWRRGDSTWFPRIPAYIFASTDIVREYALEI